jgi:hypothetical protein
MDGVNNTPHPKSCACKTCRLWLKCMDAADEMKTEWTLCCTNYMSKHPIDENIAAIIFRHVAEKDTLPPSI